MNRPLVGGVVFVAGLAGLTWWANGHQAVEIQEEITEGAEAVSATSIHPTTVMVEGRDITITGTADTEAERSSLIAALENVEGERVVNDNLTVLPTASPYMFEGVRDENGLMISGNVPMQGAIDALAASGYETGSLEMASGAPEGWNDAVSAGLNGLSTLETGTLTITDTTMSITGEAATPAEQETVSSIWNSLPAGYEGESNITALDDGKPDFTLDYEAGKGVAIVGKLPAGTTEADVAEALGVESVSGNAITSIGEDSAAVGVIDTLATWLPEFESAKVERISGQTTITAMAAPGADVELLGEDLGAEFPNAKVNIAPYSGSAEEGATRTNAFTGGTEMFRNGYWLPSMEFVADQEACTRQVEELLSRLKVNFITGSARLDARSQKAVNNLAGVAIVCVQDAGLSLEVGGHTDNTGDANANLELSKERADTVRAALIARGVPEGAITAEGFGASQPITTNDTEEGRAQNRRTTIIWSN